MSFHCNGSATACVDWDMFEDLEPQALTAEERAFADAYIDTRFNGAQAYLRAFGAKNDEGFPIDAQQARKKALAWRRRPAVQRYLRWRCRQLWEESRLSQAELVQTARKVVAVGMGDIPVRRTLTLRTGERREFATYEPNLTAALAALRTMVKIAEYARSEPRTAGNPESRKGATHLTNEARAHLEAALQQWIAEEANGGAAP